MTPWKFSACTGRSREQCPVRKNTIQASRLILPLLFIFVSLPAMYSQTLDATVRGVLTDQTGGLLPNVLINAINEETNEARQTYSSVDGEYAITALMPGSYRFEVELSGYRKYVRTGVNLRVGQKLRLNITLDHGGPSDVIVITAQSGIIEPDTTNLGAVIDNQQIVSLPLDRRNFLELSLLLPGATPSAQGSPGSIRGEFAVNVSGGREDSNNFNLDGAFNNDPKLNSFAINPPVDAIREFAVLTSTYDAQFGRSGGSQINMALKSGTNRFHGTVYEFFRNAALDAQNYFSNAEDGEPRYQRNQFGFSLGGPIRKDSTFFFMDYEGWRIREGITQITNVPTELERAGDFSQSMFTKPIDPYTGLPFDMDSIPSDRINDVGSAIANLYPLPNRSETGKNYVSSPILRDRNDHFDIRIDQAFSAKSNLFTRYSFVDRDLYEPFSGPNFARIPEYGANVPRRAQNLLIGEDHALSSTLINQVRIAFNRVSLGSFQEFREGSLNEDVGIPELSSNPRDFGLSFITVSGYSPIGDEYNNPNHSVTNVYQINDTLSYWKGKHLLKFGMDFRALQQNAFRDIQSRGFLTFSDYGQVTGNGLADMLLGFVTYSGGAKLDNPQYLRNSSWNFFIQDSYRLRPDITLQLGMRYEYNSPAVDKYDHANTFDSQTGMLVPVGQGDVPRSVYAPDRNNFGPRIGIAWSPDSANKAVIHAGYGIYFDQSSLAPGEGLYFNKPYYDFRLYFPLPGYPLTLDDPFPASYPLAIPASALGFDPSLRTSYTQQWNFAFGMELSPSQYFEIAYVGSKGSKILSARDINQPAASPMQPNLRPLPQFADILYLESRGDSSYNSLQVKFQQRLQAGVSALLSYTFGKSLDDNSTFFSSAGDSNFPQNSANPAAERARSNFDTRHRFSLGYSYDFPIGRGRQFLSNHGFFSELLSGWSTHGIVTFQSGRPFTVALLPEIDNSNTGIASLGFGANNRPNRIESGEVPDPGPDSWFDPGAFPIAEYGSFGNSGRNILDGPGYKDFGLSLIKSSNIRESLNLQFRTEFFNAFNSVNFNLPDIFIGSPTAGKVLSAQSARRIQFGLKLIF
jgi:hypothetical protein